MTDYLEIGGTTPSDEECVNVSKTVDYMPAMRAEANRFVEMLKLRFPNCDAVDFVIKSNPHDFGSYLDIRAVFHNEIGREQAFFIEGNMPCKWTDTEVLTFVPEEVDDSVDDPRDEFSQFEEDWKL